LSNNYLSFDDYNTTHLPYTCSYICHLSYNTTTTHLPYICHLSYNTTTIHMPSLSSNTITFHLPNTHLSSNTITTHLPSATHPCFMSSKD
jgi:hypothetical protein